MKDIVIVDEYIEEMKEFCRVQGNRFEMALAKYIIILWELNMRGVVKGQTADTLKAFIETAVSLKGHVAEISILCQQLLGNYLTEIDKADKELY